MFDLIEHGKALFGECTEYYEAIKNVNAVFSGKQQLLNVDYQCIFAFLSSFLPRDRFSITFDIGEEYVILSDMPDQWEQIYTRLKRDIDANDDIAVRVHIDKFVDANGCLSIYNLKRFKAYLVQTLKENLLLMFVRQIEDQACCFKVLDQDVCVTTQTFSFISQDIEWNAISKDERKKQLAVCSDASVFSDQHRIPLTPYDFQVLQSNDEDLRIILGKLKTVLSYCYLGSSSYISQDHLFVRNGFNNPYQTSLEALDMNDNAYEIFAWAFRTENVIERAAISRNVIQNVCKSKNEFFDIDSYVLSTIKSNYHIYQKKHVEQYIELKSKISSFIAELSNQLYEIYHGMVDGIRNNIAAVFTFFITVILTEALDATNLKGVYFSDKLIVLFWMLIISSFIYLLLIYISTNAKWKLVESNYTELKKNYEDTLDEMDLNSAFNDDSAMNNARSILKMYKKWIGIFWITFLVILIIFVENHNPKPILPTMKDHFYEKEYIETKIDEQVLDDTSGSPSNVPDYPKMKEYFL